MLALLVGALVQTACNSQDDSSRQPSTPRSIRAMVPTTTPRNLGSFETGNAWLFGTATPTLLPTATGTPGPSPTPTVTPTPLNAETLKGQLLFRSSRPLPAAYSSTSLSNLQVFNSRLFQGVSDNGNVIWRFDPVWGKLAPCDSPPATPTPFPAGTPTPVMLFSDMSRLLQKPASECQAIYDAAITAQTWSADKRFEVYIGSDPNGGRPQVFVIDHSTHTQKMVTHFGVGVSYDAVFAPDGYHLAFISQELGQDNLYTITRDGTDLKRLTRLPGQAWTTTWEWIKRPTWSADGTQLAVWSNKVSGARQIWVLHADGTNLHSISNDPRPAEDWDPVWVR
ncbi:MAG: PD40 domain-containing protein [Chloroflexi bacterium]|nr:PD40 domain-containing protein [Chloroflexota bacterium]